MKSRLLLDNSAWQRLGSPGLLADRAREVADLMESGSLITSLPLLLEAGYSALGVDDHHAIGGRLARLERVEIDVVVEARATEAQIELVRAASQRVPPMDLVLAALADRHGLGILHYDRHFDLIAANSGLTYESVWLAPRGSLD